MISSQAGNAGELPDDPAAFIAEAERLSNAFDADGAAAGYADDAYLESVTDGALDSYRGLPEIKGAWRVYMTVLRSVGLRLRKRLLVASGDVIMNDWHGELANGAMARGVERWRFDAHARVVEHGMFTHLDVRPSTSTLQRLRLLVCQPRIAISYLRARHSTSLGAS